MPEVEKPWVRRIRISICLGKKPALELTKKNLDKVKGGTHQNPFNRRNSIWSFVWHGAPLSLLALDSAKVRSQEPSGDGGNRGNLRGGPPKEGEQRLLPPPSGEVALASDRSDFTYWLSCHYGLLGILYNLRPSLRKARVEVKMGVVRITTQNVWSAGPLHPPIPLLSQP